jgi:hypothetical protein
MNDRVADTFRVRVGMVSLVSKSSRPFLLTYDLPLKISRSPALRKQ